MSATECFTVLSAEPVGEPIMRKNLGWRSGVTYEQGPERLVQEYRTLLREESTGREVGIVLTQELSEGPPTSFTATRV